MTDTVIEYRFRMREGTAVEWTAANEVLLQGEWGLETDTRLKKVGDGVTAWNSLSYDSSAGAGAAVLCRISMRC